MNSIPKLNSLFTEYSYQEIKQRHQQQMRSATTFSIPLIISFSKYGHDITNQDLNPYPLSHTSKINLTNSKHYKREIDMSSCLKQSRNSESTTQESERFRNKYQTKFLNNIDDQPCLQSFSNKNNKNSQENHNHQHPIVRAKSNIQKYSPQKKTASTQTYQYKFDKRNSLPDNNESNFCFMSFGKINTFK